MVRILVVEDEPTLRELVSFVLSGKGYEIMSVSTGEEAVEALHKHRPELVVLDIMLPGIDGWEVCKRIRRMPAFEKMPIIILSQRGSEDEIVEGLQTFADDYIPKPFSPKILLARIEAVLRRRSNTPAAERKTIVHGPISLDKDSLEVYLHGKPIKLRLAEFKILALLAGNPNRVFTKQQILDEIRSYEARECTDRVVDNHIFWVRQKLEDAGELLETVKGVGYRLKPVEE